MPGNDRKAVLSVRGLSKTIGKRKIVQDVAFDVWEGEIFGFLGPNGAGKTTTIRMLVGLIRPTGGTVTIEGHDLTRHFTQAISQVGAIVENPEMYPYLTGRENLEHFARMEGQIPTERIEEVVQLVELRDRIDEPVKTYSLGMRQRLGIAQALLRRPRLLILDEPTNGLDPSGIREMRRFIQRLAKEQGISVFISSHILHEVQLLCDRVAIISKGKVVRTGPVSQLLEGESPVEWRVHPTEKGVEIFRSLPAVTALESLSDSGVIRTHLPEDSIADVNRALLEAGVQVTEIRRKHPTLEDVFLQMTEGDHIA
ncbi:ABC transporter ATP-binding protein [Desmospora profundinema]|uniref:ABC-2 type transport system ATP-binding protein n=1 Tax=Desmospora profundinema TaxID=1571184 RepID=A0ABU1INL7_9BACL|nr:ABC transporter ATP-binding protein [Desmospora profundinema]MDR6226377.1 ABC-2 type transport system ATP-binding protein [Desmospora profundinema]